MRILTHLTATADAEYANDYHHKLRGRIWRALEGTRFAGEHDSSDPNPFVFSNPFPWGDLEEGDERYLLVASPYEQLLAAVARDFQQNPKVEISSMLFAVEDLTALEPDVGEPGSHGVLETGTGVLVRMTPKHKERYGIEDGHGDSPTFWRPEHTMKPFREAVRANLQHKHDLFREDHVTGPEELDHPLFDGFDLIKTYALPLTVTTGERRTVVLSKWRLEYRIRSDAHRRALNLALDCGIGGRNGLGLGFLNLQERTGAARSTETVQEGT